MLLHGENIPNKFRILKERHIQLRKPHQLVELVGLKTHLAIVPRSGIKITTSLLHSFMAKMSNALNHSAMEAVVIGGRQEPEGRHMAMVLARIFNLSIFT